MRPNDQVVVVDRNGSPRKAKILQVMSYEGLDRVEIDEGMAGNIVCVTGIDN